MILENKALARTFLITKKYDDNNIISGKNNNINDNKMEKINYKKKLIKNS